MHVPQNLCIGKENEWMLFSTKQASTFSQPPCKWRNEDFIMREGVCERERSSGLLKKGREV